MVFNFDHVNWVLAHCVSASHAQAATPGDVEHSEPASVFDDLLSWCAEPALRGQLLPCCLRNCGLALRPPRCLRNCDLGTLLRLRDLPLQSDDTADHKFKIPGRVLGTRLRLIRLLFQSGNQFLIDVK